MKNKLIINGIDFDKRLDDAKNMLFSKIDMISPMQMIWFTNKKMFFIISC